MAAFGVGGGSQQQQQSMLSQSGLRGSSYFGGAAKQAFNQGSQLSGLSNHALGNYAVHPQNYYDFGQQLLPTGKYGLGPNADNAVAMFGQNMFNKTSADMGQRGFLSPESQAGVVGSAIQNSLPQLIPQIMDYQKTQFMAPQTLMNTAATSADYWSRVLGAQSKSQGTGSSDNYNFNMGVLGG